MKYIFFTTFYGLYFNHQLHITLKISSSSYMFHGDLLWAAFMYCIYTCLSDLWALPSCIPCRLCSCHMILESSYKLTSDNHPDVLQSTSINRSGLFDGFSWWCRPFTSVDRNKKKVTCPVKKKLSLVSSSSFLLAFSVKFWLLQNYFQTHHHLKINFLANY